MSSDLVSKLNPALYGRTPSSTSGLNELEFSQAGKQELAELVNILFQEMLAQLAANGTVQRYFGTTLESGFDARVIIQEDSLIILNKNAPSQNGLRLTDSNINETVHRLQEGILKQAHAVYDKHKQEAATVPNPHGAFEGPADDAETAAPLAPIIPAGSTPQRVSHQALLAEFDPLSAHSSPLPPQKQWLPDAFWRAQTDPAQVRAAYIRRQFEEGLREQEAERQRIEKGFEALWQEAKCDYLERPAEVRAREEATAVHAVALDGTLPPPHLSTSLEELLAQAEELNARFGIRRPLFPRTLEQIARESQALLASMNGRSAHPCRNLDEAMAAIERMNARLRDA